MFNFKPLKHLAALGLSCLLVLALTGCGKTLDFRNAEIVNGKIYKEGANEAFSGKVTNIPALKIYGSQEGLKPFMAVAERVGLNDLPINSAMCDVQVDKGWLDGNVVCMTARSDTPVLRMKFTQGALEGKVEYDNPDNKGQVLVSGTFNNAQPDGKQEIFSPKTGKLIHVMHWKAGVMEGDEFGFYEDGNRAMQATLVNGKYDGAFVQYAPDGKSLIYKATYSSGSKTGNEDQYNPETGKPVGHAEWKDGKPDGIFRQWDGDGNLISDKKYADGVEVTTGSTDQPSSNSADIDACVSQWSDAFHKGNEDQPITADQSSEFEEWCKQGKHPG